MLILSSETGSVCMLKTGVKDGPTKGKSFYVCVEKRGCEFCQPARSVQHKYTTIELMRLSPLKKIKKKKKNTNILLFEYY